MLVLLPLLTRWFFYLDRMDKKYVVYQHVTPDGMYYFGQTQNVERRWKNNGAEYKGTSLYPYIEKFGWNNIQHIVLFKDQTRENALWIENFLIETAREDGVCINQQRSGLISKEEDYYRDYDQKRSEKRREYKREYYERNKGKLKEYGKKHYETNKDNIREQQKQYYEQHRDEIIEQSRQYYQKNRDKIIEYNRQYRQRKKLEKQLKEVVQTTLF